MLASILIAISLALSVSVAMMAGGWLTAEVVSELKLKPVIQADLATLATAISRCALTNPAGDNGEGSPYPSSSGGWASVHTLTCPDGSSVLQGLSVSGNKWEYGFQDYGMGYVAEVRYRCAGAVCNTVEQKVAYDSGGVALDTYVQPMPHMVFTLVEL